MKFKKVLAGLTAAALAVGSLSLVSWAEDGAVTDRELNTGSLGAAELEENQWVPGTIANPYVTLDNKWGNATPVEGYSAVEIEYTCGAVDEIANLYLVAQNGTMPDNWFQQTSAAKASGKITLDLSTVQDKTYECLLVQVQPNNTYSIGDTFDPKFEVTSAKLIAAKSGETSGEEEEPGEEEEINPPADFVDLTGKAEIVLNEEGTDFSHYKWDLGTALDEGKDISDIKKVSVVFSDESVDAMKSGAGGGLVFGTKSNGWIQKSWCNGCGEDEGHDYQVDTDTKSVTYIVADDVVIEEYAAINIQRWWGGLLEIVKINILDSTNAVIGTIEAEEEEEPGEDDPIPDEIPAVVKFYTQGTDWSWLDNGDTNYTVKSDADTVVLKWEPIAVPESVASASAYNAGGLQVSFPEDTEIALVGKKVKIEITDIVLDGEAIDSIIDEYTIVANWNSSATEVMVPLDFISFDAVGKNLSATIKVTPVTAGDNNDDNNNDDNNNDDNNNDDNNGDNTVIVPSGSGNFVVPGGSSESTAAADETSAPADDTTAADNKPADTTAADNKPADDTTANGDDSSSAPASNAPEADTQAPAATGSVNGDGNANNADKNQNTGFALALIPAAAAAAGVVIAKKRK